jgi:hypothetical protein
MQFLTNNYLISHLIFFFRKQIHLEKENTKINVYQKPKKIEVVVNLSGNSFILTKNLADQHKTGVGNPSNESTGFPYK